MEFLTFKVEIEEKIPKKIKVEITPIVYALLKNGEIIKLTTCIVEDFDHSHALDFDLKFSDSVLISYSDLVSSSYSRVKILKYSLPRNVLKIAEILEIKNLISDSLYYVVNIYKVKEEKMFVKEKTVKTKSIDETINIVNNLCASI
ncbi:MAG: hypothetical protein DRJ44_02295 [Thermoprotei archaeon]|nr:MAG: hypothetical protein DRJ44_02295 [Thermoprotei archaeon]